MWVLVYVEAGIGSLGVLGIIMAVILGCAMVYAIGVMGFTWVTIPYSTWLLLNEIALPPWLLPALLIGGLLLNLFLRKFAGCWHPMSLISIGVVISVVLGIVFCIDDQQAWYHYLWILPLFALVGTLVLYPYLWLLIGVTALPLVIIDRKYAVGALCCLVGLAAGVVMLHSGVALVAALFQSHVPLAIDQGYLGFAEIVAKIFGVVPTEAMLRQVTSVYDGVLAWLGSIPLGWRFFLSTVLCIGCTIGEWSCSEEML